MRLEGTQTLPQSPDVVWEALLNPEVLKQCIQGCEKFEATGENMFAATVSVAIGPVKARFNSTVELADVNPPVSCTLKFNGQGGVAGFGKGQAKVTLAPAPEGTLLTYDADATVGGKLAQIGSRLVDGAARKMTEDFFNKFTAVLAARSAAATAEVPAGASAEGAAAPAPVVVSDQPEPRRGADPSAPINRWWLIAAAAAFAIIWYFANRT